MATDKLKDIVVNGSWRKVTNYQKFLKYDKSQAITQITSYGYIIPKDVIIKQAKLTNYKLNFSLISLNKFLFLLFLFFFPR